VLAQQRSMRRFRRRVLATAALAASLLLAVLAFSLPNWGRDSWGSRQFEEIRLALFGGNAEGAVVGEPVARGPADDHVPTLPSLDDSIAEAGTAVASLTRRTADETVGQTGLLLPESIPTPPLPGADTLTPSVELPAAPLREAEEGISAGLEPVA